MRNQAIAVVAVATMLLAVLGATVPLVVAQEPPREMPEVEVYARGGWARFKAALNYTAALELAYAIRNLTYDLFQWEIKYNVTVARVQLDLGDKFLQRAINISERSPKLAAVFAFVAAVHYSKAPALANPVLGKVIRSNLGENETITEQTVSAVISVSGELRELLSRAISKAEEYGVNTTAVAKLLELGDSRLQNATSLLKAGNVTDAFRYAVSGYRIYVRAYATLVKATFAKYAKEVTAEAAVPPAKAILPLLPEGLRKVVESRVKAGEITKVRELVEAVRDEAEKVREQVRYMEKEKLKQVLAEKIKSTVGQNFTKVVEGIVEQAYKEGYRGVELARKVIEAVREKLAEKVGSIAEKILEIREHPAKAPTPFHKVPPVVPPRP